MQKNKIISIFISLLIIGGVVYMLVDPSVSDDSVSVTQSQNVEIRDGVQYVTITAQGGYLPRTSIIQPGVPTKLVVKTDGTYDCSASLAIRSIGFQKILEPNGEEIIDLGIPTAGNTIQGLCGMGMYSFQIRSNED